MRELEKEQKAPIGCAEGESSRPRNGARLSCGNAWEDREGGAIGSGGINEGEMATELLL